MCIFCFLFWSGKRVHGEAESHTIRCLHALILINQFTQQRLAESVAYLLVVKHTPILVAGNHQKLFKELIHGHWTQDHKEDEFKYQ